MASKMSSFINMGFRRHSILDIDFERGFLKLGRNRSREGGGGGGGAGGGAGLKRTPFFSIDSNSLWSLSFSFKDFSSLIRVFDSSFRTISLYLRISAKAKSWCSAFCFRKSEASCKYWKMMQTQINYIWDFSVQYLTRRSWNNVMESRSKFCDAINFHSFKVMLNP